MHVTVDCVFMRTGVGINVLLYVSCQAEYYTGLCGSFMLYELKQVTVFLGKYIHECEVS